MLSKFKVISYFIVALFFLSINGYSQGESKKIREKISSIVLPNDRNYFFEGLGKKGTITFSFAIGTDSVGKIDTIQFSNTVISTHLDFVNFTRVEKALKEEVDFFKEYKNTLFFGMVLLANGELEEVNPKELYLSWPKLLENLDSLKGGKKLVVLSPAYKLFYSKKIN